MKITLENFVVDVGDWLAQFVGYSVQRVVSDSPGLVNSVLNLPKGQVKYFEGFNLQKNCEIISICSSKNFRGLLK